MKDEYLYDVVIAGMESIPLRTTKEGAKALMLAFDNGEATCDILVNAMKEGIAFKNRNVSVTMAGTQEEPPKPKSKKKK